MNPVTSDAFKEHALWLIIFFMAAFGFRHIKQMVAFLLYELYKVFIENNPTV